MEKELWQQMSDGAEVYVRKWYRPETKPKAIVQIAHGMVEHINRYREFAEYLLERDIFVYGNDHRGHGKTAVKQGRYGYFAERDGFNRVTQDLKEVTDEIRKEYPQAPMFLLGHSMGSFLARNYIQNGNNDLNGAVMMGTGYYPRFVSLLGRGLSFLLPAQKESKLMHEIAFGSNNRRIANHATRFDWLSSDSKEVQAFLDDPYTDFIPTGRFFYDLMSGLSGIHDRKLIKSVRSDLSLLFISGGQDPVGSYEKGIWRAAHLYERAGVQDIITMLFDEDRHEILHELNREEVFEVLHAWINNRLT
ncbi:alpha/beta fold hydrolase [Virgibacillus xinjiangensis]|uniref:Alpha/beta fold hydrolase n=1 Tax=Virgibacillus xinjiangensis TaxID=393090 RepID=A0ABV7CXW5_9BACI